MKRFLWCAVLAAAVFLAGCGLAMNADYAERLDRQAMLAEVQHQKAEAGDLEPADMAAVLKASAAEWKAFQQARGPWFGLSPVWMNTEYTQRVDKTVAWTADMVRRTEAGNLDEAQLKRVLAADSKLWRLFNEARVAPEEDE